MLEQANIPGYRIVRELGRGGMGTVHLALQESLGREVALKLLTPQLVVDPVATERFMREGRIAAHLSHRHIVSVHDVGVHAGQPYIAMEYMSRGSVASSNAIAPSEALEITRQIALALDHAHQEGVIHRDLKPENILQRKDGSFALADFGIACALNGDGAANLPLTREGTTVGTPYYMSPEQLQAQPLDGRSDLYSLGVVLFQMLAGQLPYQGSVDTPVGMQHVHAPLPRLPDDLERYQPLISALMAKSPAQRPATGAELAQRIEAIQTSPKVALVTQVLPSASARRGRMLAWMAALVLALGAGGYFVRHYRATPAPTPTDTARAAGPVPDATPTEVSRSIAVLPLVNSSNEPEQQFFSDGLSENLIDTLSGFEGLKVIGRTSAFQFRDSKDDSATIGRKLGVSYLLSGSVQRAGDLVRISASLIKAADGSTLWAEHYDRPYQNLFALQDEIAHAVSSALQVKLLSPSESAKHYDRPPSGNLEVYNLYLQGLKFWHEERFADASGYMRRAVELDPDYAMAWALLSGSLSTVATFDEAQGRAREDMETARLAADKALQLAPDLGAAHAARAYLQVYTFDHAGALAECRRAVQLAPEDGTVLNGCGYVFAQVGHLAEALRVREHLLTIEPLYLINYQQYARTLMAVGRLDEAEKYLNTAENLPHVNSWWRSSAYFLRMCLAMMRADADMAMEIAMQMPEGDRELYKALAAQIGPDRGKADAALASVVANGDLTSARPYLIAQIHALRDDADGTLEWLQRVSTGKLIFMPTDPIIMNMRNDPGFIAFCEKYGLPRPNEIETLSINQIRAASSRKD